MYDKLERKYEEFHEIFIGFWLISPKSSIIYAYSVSDKGNICSENLPYYAIHITCLKQAKKNEVIKFVGKFLFFYSVSALFYFVLFIRSAVNIYLWCQHITHNK